MPSLFNLYQQVYKKTQKGGQQEIIRAIINVYSSVAEKSYYVGKKDEGSALDGSFMQVYENIPILNDGKYYVVFPSTYLLLPHSFGIKTVDFTGGNAPFWKVDNWSMFKGLKSSVMGGNFVYQPSGIKCYFPNLSESDILGAGSQNKTIMMELACAYDGIDVDESLNISGNMADQLVQMVIALFVPTVEPVNENIK